MVFEDIRIVKSGGYVIHVDICSEISLDCAREAHKLYYLSRRELAEVVDEIVLGVTSLAIYYDPRKVGADLIVSKLRDLWSWARGVDLDDIYRPKTFTIPVAYGGDYGPDLNFVARWSGLTEEVVVRLHTSRRYTCITLGFTPGFVYLGEVDPSIAAPRLETPRIRIPAGSVGIAGKMTGVYGLESPGGWRLIGRTPLTMFDPRRSPPIPISPGDQVEFRSISYDDYRKLSGVYIDDYSS